MGNCTTMLGQCSMLHIVADGRQADTGCAEVILEMTDGAKQTC
jgi:hypothetical protein